MLNYWLISENACSFSICFPCVWIWQNFMIIMHFIAYNLNRHLFSIILITWYKNIPNIHTARIYMNILLHFGYEDVGTVPSRCTVNGHHSHLRHLSCGIFTVSVLLKFEFTTCEQPACGSLTGKTLICGTIEWEPLNWWITASPTEQSFIPCSTWPVPHNVNTLVTAVQEAQIKIRCNQELPSLLSR